LTGRTKKVTHLLFEAEPPRATHESLMVMINRCGGHKGLVWNPETSRQSSFDRWTEAKHVPISPEQMAAELAGMEQILERVRAIVSIPAEVKWGVVVDWEGY
jgi:hypothetical protein